MVSEGGLPSSVPSGGTMVSAVSTNSVQSFEVGANMTGSIFESKVLPETITNASTPSNSAIGVQAAKAIREVVKSVGTDEGFERLAQGEISAVSPSESAKSVKEENPPVNVEKKAEDGSVLSERTDDYGDKQTKQNKKEEKTGEKQAEEQAKAEDLRNERLRYLEARMDAIVNSSLRENAFLREELKLLTERLNQTQKTLILVIKGLYDREKDPEKKKELGEILFDLLALLGLTLAEIIAGAIEV